MTDLKQFEFITRFSTTESENKKWNWLFFLNENDHNFIIRRKFSDNSGATIKCSKCSLTGYVNKKNDTKLVFYAVNNFVIKNIVKLTCNEIIIKNFLE